MIKENQATIIQIIPVIIFENSIILDTVWAAGLKAAALKCTRSAVSTENSGGARMTTSSPKTYRNKAW